MTPDLQTLRDLWTVKFGETWAWNKTHVPPEWETIYLRLCHAFQFEWVDKENYVGRLKERPRVP